MSQGFDVKLTERQQLIKNHTWTSTDPPQVGVETQPSQTRDFALLTTTTFRARETRHHLIKLEPS